MVTNKNLVDDSTVLDHNRPQEKQVSKIQNNTYGTYETLHSAKKNPNDEFYTSLQDIHNELKLWGDKLRGKHIICPCDCDIFEGDEVYAFRITFSDKPKISTMYQILHPEVTDPYQVPIEDRSYDAAKIEWPVGLEYFLEDEVVLNDVPKKKKRQQSLFDLDKVFVDAKTITDLRELREIVSKRVTCNFIKCLYGIGIKYGIKSITASGYDVETGRGIKFQDVDYSKFDVAITNPPFSLYSQWMNIMTKEHLKRRGTDKPFDFICLAPFLNRANPNVGLNLMLGNCYLGYGRNIAINFTQPTYDNNFIAKAVACDWLVTWPDAQEYYNSEAHTEYWLDYKVYAESYPIVDGMTMKDGSHPIRVGKGTIPGNYLGWMFGPISVLDVLPQDKYEWYGTSFYKYFNQQHPELNPCAHKMSNKMVSMGNKQLFHGIVFKKKK